VFKDIFKNHVMERKINRDGSVRYDPGLDLKKDNKEVPVVQGADDRVGDIDTEGGFGLGKADPNSKPKEIFFGSPSKTDQQPHETKTKFHPTTANSEEMKRTYQKAPDKNIAFAEYKDSKGRDTILLIERDKETLREKKELIKSLSLKCTQIKTQIEELTAQVTILKSTDDGSDQYRNVLHSLKALKSEYKEHLQEVKEAKGTIIELQEGLERNKLFLVSDFEKWYEE